MEVKKPNLPALQRTTTKTRKYQFVLWENDTPPSGSPGSVFLPVTVEDLCEMVISLPPADRFLLSCALEDARQAALEAEKKPLDLLDQTITHGPVTR